jgi:asparagine synthetase B (glutamine-hydrolysing)
MRMSLDLPGSLRFIEGEPRSQIASYIETVHHEFNFTVLQGIDSLKEVIYFLKTYNPTSIRASTPMYLWLARLMRWDLRWFSQDRELMRYMEAIYTSIKPQTKKNYE